MSRQARFPEAGRKLDVLRLIGTFRFALAMDWDLDLNPDGDEPLPYLFAITLHQLPLQVARSVEVPLEQGSWNQLLKFSVLPLNCGSSLGDKHQADTEALA